MSDEDEIITRLFEDEMPAEAWVPPTCQEAPGECVWEQETVGHNYDGSEQIVYHCETHGTEFTQGQARQCRREEGP